MAVKARFYVREITKTATYEDGGTIVLGASVMGEPNKAWSKYTPSGEIRMTVTNPAAFAWFEERFRKDLAITFDDIPAEPVTQ